MNRTIYRVDAPSVIFEQFDGELVAIHLETGAYHSLFGTSADAFMLLTQECSLEELAETLHSKYDAPLGAIAMSLKPFLDSLIAEKLIAVVEVTPARRALELERPATKLPYTPPSLQAYHDLQSLFLLDPVHEVGEHGWPQAMHEAGDAEPA